MAPIITQPRDIQQMKSAVGKRRIGVIPIPRVAAEWAASYTSYLYVVHAGGFLDVVYFPI